MPSEFFVQFKAAIVSAASLSAVFFTLTGIAVALLAPSDRRTLALWLSGEQDETLNWRSTFCSLFDSIFGKHHFSFRCFLSSALASIISVFVLYAILSGTGAMQFRAENTLPIVTVLLLGATINVIPDWLSLSETRWILQKFERLRSIHEQIVVLIADFLISGTIIWLGIKLWLWALGEPQVGLVEMALVYSAYAVFFWSTFLTSMWAWLFCLTAWMIRLVARTRLRRLDVETNPGGVMGFAGVIFIFPLVFLVSLTIQGGWRTVDTLVCRYSPTHCPLAIRAQRETPAAFTMLEKQCRLSGSAYMDKDCLRSVYDRIGWTEAEGADLAEIACHSGDIAGCFWLGYFLNSGVGRPANPIKASTFLRRACDGKDMRGCVNLGLMLEVGRVVDANPTEARSLYRRACSGGYLFACVRLGDLLRKGVGGDVDPVEARVFYRLACDSEYLPGCTSLGMMLEFGKGGKVDLIQARALYRRACDSGYAFACYSLGLMLEAGIGGDTDHLEAQALFLRACESEIEWACDRLDARP